MAGRALVIGYGNAARGDDGLGPALVARLEAAPIAGLELECAYQLGIEHAELVARHDLVFFVDAAVDGPEPFACTPVSPSDVTAFTTHSLSPGVVVALASACFGRTPRAHLVAIRGHAFEEPDTLTAAAQANLDASLAFLREALRSVVSIAAN